MSDRIHSERSSVRALLDELNETRQETAGRKHDLKNAKDSYEKADLVVDNLIERQAELIDAISALHPDMNRQLLIAKIDELIAQELPF